MKKFFDNYPMLKEYEDIEPYMEELRDYANIFENIEIDRIEAKKQIVRDKKEIERLNKELEYEKKLVNAMIDNEEEYCIEINNLKERIAYLERSNDRREEEIISLRDELVGEDK